MRLRRARTNQGGRSFWFLFEFKFEHCNVATVRDPFCYNTHHVLCHDHRKRSCPVNPAGSMGCCQSRSRHQARARPERLLDNKHRTNPGWRWHMFARCLLRRPINIANWAWFLTYYRMRRLQLHFVHLAADIQFNIKCNLARQCQSLLIIRERAGLYPIALAP